MHGQYYLRTLGRGLTVLYQDSFHIVPNGGKFANELIYVMVPFVDQCILIGTRTQGMFIYEGRDFTLFKTHVVHI